MRKTRTVLLQKETILTKGGEPARFVRRRPTDLLISRAPRPVAMPGGTERGTEVERRVRSERRAAAAAALRSAMASPSPPISLAEQPLSSIGFGGYQTALVLEPADGNGAECLEDSRRSPPGS